MTVLKQSKSKFYCLSSDTKPTTFNGVAVSNGTELVETDTGAEYMRISGSWIAKVNLQYRDIAILKPALYVPLLIYPSPTTDWARVADLKDIVPGLEIVVQFNVSNGDGIAARDTDFAAGITLLSDKGVKPIGYVYTTGGARSAATVKTCIDTYVTYYPEIRGIFFDQMDNVAGHEAYYADLETYVKVTKKLDITIGSPGASTQPSYIGIFDRVLTYIDDHLPDNTEQLAATNAGAFNRSNFLFTPYSIASITVAQIKDLTTYAGMVHVTSDNDYDTLPAYLEDLAIMIDNAY